MSNPNPELHVENLQPYSPGEDRARINGKKGAEITHKKEKEKKSLKELFNIALESQINEEDYEKAKGLIDKLGEKSQRALMISKMIANVNKSDELSANQLKTIDMLMEYSGQKEKETNEEENKPEIKIEIVDNKSKIIEEGKDNGLNDTENDSSRGR